MWYEKVVQQGGFRCSWHQCRGTKAHTFPRPKRNVQTTVHQCLREDYETPPSPRGPTKCRIRGTTDRRESGDGLTDSVSRRRDSWYGGEDTGERLPATPCHGHGPSLTLPAPLLSPLGAGRLTQSRSRLTPAPFTRAPVATAHVGSPVCRPDPEP